MFRVKTTLGKSPQFTVKTTPTDTYQDLLDKIAAVVGTADVLLKAGTPPKPFDADKAALVKDVLKGGQVLFAVGAGTSPTPNQQATGSMLPQGAALNECKPSLGEASTRITSDEGFLLRRDIVPADNDCLFASVARLAAVSGKPRDSPAHLRATVARLVLADPDDYNEAVLGVPPSLYVQRLTGAMWGGEVELRLLSDHTRLAIRVMSIESGKWLVYGGEENDRSICVLYDGIHYDPLVLDLAAGVELLSFTSREFEQLGVAALVERLAKANRDARAFTNTSQFALRCLACNQALKGQSDAQAHVKAFPTHTNFAEY